MRYIKIDQHKTSQLCVYETENIEKVIKNLDQSGLQIVLILNLNNQFIGTITDGDVRRGLLKGVSLNGMANEIMNSSPQYIHDGEGLEQKLMSILSGARIIHLPIVNGDNCVIGMFLSEQFASHGINDNLVVVMAGGEGKRMRPLTESCPKAMLKIGDKPILEHVLDRFIDEGYINFCFSVKYMSHIIKDYFGDGSKWGVSIKYLEENVPLGTAGSLSLLDELPEKPILVTNCDVLTEVKYSHLIEYHQAHNAAATMAVREYEWAHPFGVVELSEHRILSLKEKPIYKTYINAGIYALEPSVMKEIVKNSHLDMTDLFDILIDKGMNTVAYPTHEYWFDVGRPADFHVATNRVLGVE